MNSYSLVLLLKNDLKKEAKEKLITDVKKTFGNIKNEKVENMGEKKLAYPIKRARSADFVVLKFEADKIEDGFNNKLLIKDEVLRHLLLKG